MNQDNIFDRIAEIVSSLDLPPVARLEGTRLAEAWISYVADFDAKFKTVAVEIPWFMILDEFTVIVGVQDRLAMDETGLFGCEWKTAKGTTRYWNAEKWLESIQKAHQVAIYALAQKKGYFVVDTVVPGMEKVVIPHLNGPTLWTPHIKSPRVMVRAITKEYPPQIWPSEGYHFLDFTRERLKSTESALIIRGRQIREARLSGLTPWQLPGIHCENRFSHLMCPYFEKYCKNQNHPALNLSAGIGTTDPGRAALNAAQSLLHTSLDDPRVVVLSASAYEDSTNCLEKYRIEGSERVDGDYQAELDKGSAFHAAVASYYKQFL